MSEDELKWEDAGKKQNKLNSLACREKKKRELNTKAADCLADVSGVLTGKKNEGLEQAGDYQLTGKGRESV